MAGTNRHVVILADEIDYSVVEIQDCRHLRILLDKVADERSNDALAEGDGACHFQCAARRPVTIAQPESLHPVFDHVSATIRNSVRDLCRRNDSDVSSKQSFTPPPLPPRNPRAQL